MSQLPNRRPDDGRLSQLVEATSAQQRTELAIHQHHLLARYFAECERIDIEARADVARTGLEEELNLLAWGMEQATGPAAAELVSRKVDLLSRMDNTHFARFGR